MGPKNVIDKLQKNVNTIGNQKIKSSAREKLNAFKQSGGTDTSSKNAVIKLHKIGRRAQAQKKGCKPRLFKRNER
jgi:CRISPR/Cas system-associated protein Csx1